MVSTAGMLHTTPMYPLYLHAVLRTSCYCIVPAGHMWTYSDISRTGDFSLCVVFFYPIQQDVIFALARHMLTAPRWLRLSCVFRDTWFQGCRLKGATGTLT